MIDRLRFEKIKARHGGYASWAVWADPSATPKSNVGDLQVLDPDANPTLLETIRNDVVMVGLTISRTFADAFRNFHDPSPSANDFKIRYAFSGTPYYGAYMTDIIKNIEMVRSDDLLETLRRDPSMLPAHAAIFREELVDLGDRKPTIPAFGSATYKLVLESVPPSVFTRLVKLTHYSHQIGKERYRQSVWEQLRPGRSGLSTP